LIQRLKALNHFIDDLYHDRCVIKDGVVPDDIHRDVRELPAGVHRRHAGARRLGEHLRHGSRA
jgi:uncharacterized circularly permuted ATP-grasp superfamily protein